MKSPRPIYIFQKTEMSVSEIFVFTEEIAFKVTLMQI